MATDIAIFRINYKSDFIITLESDAGWSTPFCIKFWTDSPQRAFYVQYDGETYTHCAPVAGEPTKLSVQMDDHNLGIGNLQYQIAYHFTVADFPDDTEDEVLNQAAVIINEDGQQEQVMLDFNGETAPEIEFSLPAYANEAQRIANEQQRIANETERVIEFAEIKTEAVAATNAANAAASLANEKAQLADDKAQLADSAASLATAKAQLAQEKATYAQTQGDYAKAQGDYAKAQGDTAQADHVRAEADHTTAAADHTTAASDHTQAATDHATATSDHTQAGSDHTRAESDHTRAESDHAAVEVYVDSLGAFDISAYHATGGVLAKYADLTAALGTDGANIPESLRKGGMSVKFAQSSDNKYVQYRYMSSSTASADFTNTANWQGVDETPTAGSQNLLKSSGLIDYIYNRVFTKTNAVFNLNDYLEIGKINKNASGLNYVDDAHFVRTRENIILKLKAGDVISLATHDYIIRYYAYYKPFDSDSPYTFILIPDNTSYVIPSDGEYVFTAHNASNPSEDVTMDGLGSMFIMNLKSLGDSAYKNIDSSVVPGSTNPVSSNGVKTFVEGITGNKSNLNTDAKTSLVESINEVYSKGNKNKTDIDIFSSHLLISEQSDFVTTQAGYIVSSSNGTFIQNDTNSPSAISNIPVFAGTKVKLHVPNVPIAGGRGVAFYDSNGTYISNSGVAYVIGTSDYIIQVPDNAAKMALTTFGTDGFRLAIYTNDVILYNELNAKIDIKSMKLGYDVSGETFITGSFFNVNTHRFVEHSDYGYYKVYFSPGTMFVVTPNLNNSAIGIGYFDKDGVCVGGVGYSSEQVTAIMPNNAIYAVITKNIAYALGVELIYNDVNVLQKVLYNPNKPSKNPLAKVGESPSYISMFKKIVHIGDSLTRGQYNTTSPNMNGADLPDYSRPVFMGRMIGNENINLGIGGATASQDVTWNWLDAAEDGSTFPWTDFTNPGDCYIIALGTNDITKLGSFTGDISTDIDINDYQNNATTSVGSYAKIIQMILEMQPKAKIFCVTIPKTRNTESTRSAANVKIKDIAELLGCYVIDLETYADDEDGDFSKYFKNSTHNNALGYCLRARQYIAYIDWIIENNLGDFRNVQFIGTEFDFSA